MTARRSKGCAGVEDRAGIGSSRAAPAASMRAHPHMPRFRKTISPLRASGGSTSPSMAERNVSYCVTIADESVDGLALAPVISEFFLHRLRARSFLDAHRGQIPAESASPVRAPGSAPPETAATRDK